jgi:hypothetical protein
MAAQSATTKPIPASHVTWSRNSFVKYSLAFNVQVSVPCHHYYDMRNRLDALTMPILLINRYDDALAPEPKNLLAI